MLNYIILFYYFQLIISTSTNILQVCNSEYDLCFTLIDSKQSRMLVDLDKKQSYLEFSLNDKKMILDPIKSGNYTKVYSVLDNERQQLNTKEYFVNYDDLLWHIDIIFNYTIPFKEITKIDYILKNKQGSIDINLPKEDETLEKETTENEIKHEEEESEEDMSFPILITLHGILMFLAWVILPPIAIAVAKFYKSKLGVWWFRIHILCFSFTLILSILAIILMNIHTGFLINDPHSFMGYLVTLLFFVQITLGVVIDRLFDVKRTSIPWYDKLHWWLGRFTYTLAMINFMFGLKVVPEDYWVPFWLIIISMLFALFLGFYKLSNSNAGQADHHLNLNSEPNSPNDLNILESKDLLLQR